MENRVDKKQEKKQRQEALELVRKMADSCAKNMMDAGIPIRPDRVKLIRLGKMQNTRGLCYFTMEEDGEYSFKIAITNAFAEHMHKPEVVENVRNTIYHELLHTCFNSQSHNKNFLYWSKYCDKKLGTRTLRHMEKPFYFKTAETQPFVYVCSHCGNTYYSEHEHPRMICEICNCKMRLGQDH